MPTEKPRFTITMDEGLFQRIEDFRFEGHFKNQTKAVTALIEKGLDVLSTDDSEAKKSPSTAEAAPGEEELKLMEYLKRGVYDMEFLPEGADLTDRQAEALLGVCAILHAIFNE